MSNLVTTSPTNGSVVTCPVHVSMFRHRTSIRLPAIMVTMSTMQVEHSPRVITSVHSRLHILTCAVFNLHSNIICIFNMKLYKISLALLLGLGTLTSCNDKLDLTNPNEPTTGDRKSTRLNSSHQII